MQIPRKFWLLSGAAMAALVMTACSRNALIPTQTGAPPLPHPRHGPPKYFRESQIGEMEGHWINPDRPDTISTVV